MGHFGGKRELLAALDKVRQCILTGDIVAFTSRMRCSNGQEALISGGEHHPTSAETLRALLKLSKARVLTEDEPPSRFGS